MSDLKKFVLTISDDESMQLLCSIELDPEVLGQSKKINKEIRDFVRAIFNDRGTFDLAQSFIESKFDAIIDSKSPASVSS